jgi:hypothetical protein
MLEESEPTFFDDLLSRKKWRNVQKDPYRTLKDENNDKSAYWAHLNDLPKSRVDLLISDSILESDRKSCDRILNRIYEDSKQD